MRTSLAAFALALWTLAGCGVEPAPTDDASVDAGELGDAAADELDASRSADAGLVLIDAAELGDAVVIVDATTGTDAAPPRCVSSVGECDVFAQDCPEGEACSAVQQLDGSVTTRCSPEVDCAAGEQLTGGRCRAICCMSLNECAADEACLPTRALPMLGVCVADPCELVPTTLGVCADRWLACRTYAGHTFCGDVARPTPRQEGASCSTMGDCDRGLQCLRVGAGLVCRRFCDLVDGDADCPLGSTTCEAPASIQADDGTAVTLPAGVGLCG